MQLGYDGKQFIVFTNGMKGLTIIDSGLNPIALAARNGLSDPTDENSADVEGDGEAVKKKKRKI